MHCTSAFLHSFLAAPFLCVCCQFPKPGLPSIHLSEHSQRPLENGQVCNLGAEDCREAVAGSGSTASEGSSYIPPHSHQVSLHLQPERPLQHLPGKFIPFVTLCYCYIRQPNTRCNTYTCTYVMPFAPTSPCPLHTSFPFFLGDSVCNPRVHQDTSRLCATVAS